MKNTHKVAINGFGRIGRLTFKALQEKKNIEIVAINDLAPASTLAYLLKYDSNYGTCKHNIEYDDNHIILNNKKIKIFSETNPKLIPWNKVKPHTILECSGKFLDRQSVQQHIEAGAHRVIISAPPKENNIPTIVLGVNNHILKQNDPIISNSSCTTNCLAPIVKVLDDYFGIEQGFVNTIHSYTSDQNLHDAPHKDLRRSRSATQSIIPTSTGAAKSIGIIFPHLQSKFKGIAMRVPVPTGSVVDLTVTLKKQTNNLEINQLMEQASSQKLKNILQCTNEQIVSSDIVGNTHSSILDTKLTEAQGGFVKLIAWYDNEMGYAHRMADLVAMLKF